MGAHRYFLCLLIAMWLGCSSAHAERRVALVIGNSAYKSVPRLTNPVNDAALVGGMFRKAGFDIVDIKLDVSAADMRRARAARCLHAASHTARRRAAGETHVMLYPLQQAMRALCESQAPPL